jgi:hypothetical protein
MVKGGKQTMTNLEMLRTATPEQIADIFCDMFCEKNGDCFDVCPSFLSDRCKRGKNGVLEWLNDEVNAPKDAPKDAPEDAPKGWIKLKIVKGDIYVNASAIVGLKHAMNTVSGELTAVYTIGRSSPWHVYGSIDEIMGKIERA